MEDGLVMDVEGFEEAIRKMELLREIDRTEYNDFKRGIKSAAKPFIASTRKSIEKGRERKAIQATTYKGTKKEKQVTYKRGNLRRSIGYISSKNRRNLIGYVGPRFGRKATKTGDGYYGAMVNFGTPRGKAKAQVKEKQNVGFIEKGFDGGVAQANALLIKAVGRILDKKLHQLSTKQMRKYASKL